MTPVAIYQAVDRLQELLLVERDALLEGRLKPVIELSGQKNAALALFQSALRELDSGQHRLSALDPVVAKAASLEALAKENAARLVAMKHGVRRIVERLAALSTEHVGSYGEDGRPLRFSRKTGGFQSRV